MHELAPLSRGISSGVSMSTPAPQQRERNARTPPQSPFSIASPSYWSDESVRTESSPSSTPSPPVASSRKGKRKHVPSSSPASSDDGADSPSKTARRRKKSRATSYAVRGTAVHPQPCAFAIRPMYSGLKSALSNCNVKTINSKQRSGELSFEVPNTEHCVHT